MILPSSDPRRVLPRWHSPEVSAQRPDTHSLVAGTIQPEHPSNPTEVFRRAADFAACPDDAHAGDLVSVALIARRPEVAQEAAQWILNSETASALMRQLAQMIINPEVADAQGVLAVPTDVSGTNRVVVAQRIATLRRRLSLAPDNPMAWAELARQHTLTGHLGKAKDAMRVAITRAPHDRYLLRATARLYHHTGELERAHALLARAPRTPSDPWLIAAEITFASLSDQDPRFVRAGRRLLESGVPPVHLSELASVLATLELDAGHSAHARRLFRRALVDPAENALAQAEWAAAHINLDVEPYLHSVPSSWEARALAAAAAGEPGVTISEAWGWFYDQPFASGPAVFGSYHAAKHGRFSEGANFARDGIAANPRSFLLRNNLAFCLAKIGDTDAAEQQMHFIKSEQLNRDQRATVEATHGLIAFRSGRSAEGAARYRRALDALPDGERRLLALINLAVETLRIDPQLGNSLARQSHEAANRLGIRADREAWLMQLKPGPSSTQT
jgi:tetratricopeptide (TPR) repeat protein